MIRVERAKDGTVLALTMLRPSNFHEHFRRGPLMRAVACAGMRHMKYVLVMPNLAPPITAIEEAVRYHDELMAIAQEHGFDKLKLIMTLYHTADITPKVIEQIAKSDIVFAVKHYPPHPGATTGAGHGVPLLDSTEMLDAMSEMRVPLLGHFESVYDAHGRELPHSQRESYYLTREYPRIRERHPELKMCIEHASTCEAVDRVKEDTSGNTFMTVTPQHMLLTWQEVEGRSWASHGKCMPIPKDAHHRDCILEFATSGDRRAGMGKDGAPHPRKKKEGVPLEQAASGCWLPHGLPLYVQAFEYMNAVDYRFERFASLNAPAWWGLPAPEDGDFITIRRVDFDATPGPTPIVGEEDVVVPMGWSEAADRFRTEFMVEGH